MTGSRHIAARVFAVIAALCMVTAFAIAALFPPDLLLGQLLAMADYDTLVGFQNFVRSHLGIWVWTSFCVPLIARPAWFLPLSLGLVTAGLAATLSTRPGPARSRRRS